jgi:FtsP/CotA-like multicopper oxidase with cupredoxin domain
MPFSRTACLPLLGLLSLAAADSVLAQPVTTVAANDNRRPAGVLAGSVLTVRLYVGEGEWRPEENDGPSLTVAAFGEEGGPLLTPGPLLRIPEGTEVALYVRNGLTKRLDIHGLHTRPATDDVVISVAAGETREIRFAAGTPGAYHYWATTGPALNTRTARDSQLGGAFIVDPHGAVAEDRVFVMTQWDDSRLRVDEIVNAEVRRVFAINGRSWPHTERLDERVGRPVRWHIVNLTQSGHPMHLHGFYFSVRGAGNGLRYTAYALEEYRQVVTETMPIGATRQMMWTPEGAGNWLLHCHLIAHVTPALRFWVPEASSDHAAHGSHDRTTAMAGLVIGIRVTGDEPAPKMPAISTPARRLTLSMHRRPGYWRPEDAYGFALEAAGRVSEPGDATVPGPLLVLKHHEPVEITVKNRLPEATAIHWHGIELESYFDGVPGWSGTSVSTTPAIEPGEEFVVRFTPPRAGTFIYHTHSHDTRQLASRLYGAIVVVEPGETFDSARDHLVLLGMEGAKDTQQYERFPAVVNGKRDTVLMLKAGAPNRLRFINITTNFGGLNVSLIGANQPIQWRPMAKDGADLRPHRQISRPALRQTISVGETYDFVVEPSGADVPAAGGF